jgi:hypothetical protein
VGRNKLVLAAIAASLIGACVPVPGAQAAHRFRPRIGRAMGLLPARGAQDLATAISIPLAYHGGAVMHGVTVHTIFWAPPGFGFLPAPPGGARSYQDQVQQFLLDAAHDSGSTANLFSVLGQYPDGNGAAQYRIAYDPSTDSLGDTNPYPQAGNSCASPTGAVACITDLDVQREIERNIQAHGPGGRGLHDLWLVFLPPGVDTCVMVSSCASNDFAGYHSLFNLGKGTAIYAAIPDPLIEGTPPPGSDPQGNPDAEMALDIVAHEMAEAISNPEGTGWMDPNGFEVGDKCQSGTGMPLGFAPDGAPYNQLINGREYLLQTLWSNAASGCRQSSTSTSSPLPLPRVSMNQFSPVLSGSGGRPAAGSVVTVLLARAETLVAGALTSAGADGSWRVTLRSLANGRPVGVGDDREELLVRYSGGSPAAQLIQTGDGGNPFTAAGWTGWFDLDHGFAVGPRSVLLGPCSQTGVLVLSVSGTPTGSPLEHCGSDSDAATVATPLLGPRTALSLSSEDNRAPSILAPNGALVKLTVPLGEPRSVSAVGNPRVAFDPSGFPACTADLRRQRVSCSGLVPGGRYVVLRSRRHGAVHGRAGGGGVSAFPRFGDGRGIRGGDVLTLRNRQGRVLTRLHVAHLRVDLDSARTTIASGGCEPGAFYGPALQAAPVSSAIGTGVGGTGTICPLSGRARGLSTVQIVQQDSLSGGQTRTEVPRIEGTAPVPNATLYGPFHAIAQAGLPGPAGAIIPVRSRVAVKIVVAGTHHVAFRAANVNTASGAVVTSLAPGSYAARWVLTDASGDTRTLQTTFVQER